MSVAVKIGASEEAALLPSLLNVVSSSPAHTVLAAAVAAAPDVAAALKGASDATLVAPTDEPFGKLLESLGLSADALLNSDVLPALLQYHVTKPAITDEDECEDVRDTLLEGASWTRVYNEQSGQCDLKDGGDRVVRRVGDIIEAARGCTVIVADGVLVPAGVSVAGGKLALKVGGRMNASFRAHEFHKGQNHWY